MPDMTTWLNQIPLLVGNPSNAQTIALQQLEEVLNGTADVTDPTNPAILVMEAAAVNAASAITSYETYTRRLYEKLAMTPEDLYIHMSDVDYLNRFAIPSNATFYLLLSYDELLAAMVPTGANGIRKLTIPRFTEFSVNGVAFTMQYPIDIRQVASGGLQVVYNQDTPSPIQALTSNIVPWQIVTLYETIGASKGPMRFVQLELPLRQFKIASTLIKFNYSSGVYNTYSYTDAFYYARAYAINVDGSSTEILTTHTDQTFDPTTPTLLLKDLGGTLLVELPQVYLSNRLMGTEIQLDIYSTQGQLAMPLAAYDTSSYGVKWNGATPAESVYTAPLTTLRTVSMYSTDTTHDGANAMSFTDLRNRVMTNNFGDISLPITPSQLSATLSDIGYEPVIEVDNVTDRIVLGTRELPPPADGSTLAGASMAIETLSATMDALATYQNCVANGDRLTILPTMLYRLLNSILTPVADPVIASMAAMTPDALVRSVNNDYFLYSPFHYVLDAGNNNFAVRAYHLDNPSISAIQFVDENDSIGIEVGTGDKQIVRTATGYQLTIQARSSDAWKALPDGHCFCQLAFIPEGEKTRAYMTGSLSTTLDGERVYVFNLTTNYDLDADDNLGLTSFQMFLDEARPHFCALPASFDIFWITDGVDLTNVSSSAMDQAAGMQFMPTGSIVITQETLNVTLGDALDNLWSRGRTVAGSATYQTYPADVPAVYAADVYARDPVTGQVQFTVNGTTLTMTKLHSAGDPILDANNQPTFAHRKGDQVLDGNGNPIVVSPRTLVRQVDILTIEGAYYFASKAEVMAYRQSLPVTIAGWVVEDMAPLSAKLLEETKLYFYPKGTLGDVSVQIQDGKIVQIPSSGLYAVNYYLDDAAWLDSNLRAPLTSTAVQTIATVLQNKTVSIQAMNVTLSVAAGSDVVGFEINGLGGTGNYSTLTVVDDAKRLSIRKQVVVEADGTVGIEDGVQVSFFPHSTNVSLKN